MKELFGILLLMLFVQSCSENVKTDSVSDVNWEERTIDYEPTDSLIQGTSYLSVYSHIYSQSEHRTHDLTATISLRNMNQADTIFIDKAEYFNTDGKSIRVYFDKTIYIAPMETVEIVIDEEDKSGGSGANFIFNWRVKSHSNTPLFEAVMISTSGQQGISFTTEGKIIEGGQ